MALTDTFVRQVKWSGRSSGDKHADGGGMFLLVKAAGKYWRMKYRYAGREKQLALGVYPAVSLAKARKRREEARELLADGKDPSAAKREAKAALAATENNTFDAVARDWLNKTAAKRKPATQERARAWLENDVLPYIGKLPIPTIGPRDVLTLVLRKIEARGSVETAHRVKQLCGQVMRFAVVSGLAERDITADLKEALETPTKKHYAAITDLKQAGELLRSIYTYRGHFTTEAALKLAPLVFVRPGELRMAEWAEIDLDAAEWRIPGAKMKMGTDHIVPLARQAVEILRALYSYTGHDQHVFPSINKGGRPMSENTVNCALRAMGYSQEVHTAHGFRAMARTIMDEVLGERVDLIEHQLAHAVKDVNGRAYNRTAHLPARREMMQRWADYLDWLREGAKVIPFPAARKAA